MCPICKHIPHMRGCPNETTPKAIHNCSSCGEGIFEGEEYIENNNGEMRHFDCFYGMRELLQWLGYDIKTMEDL